MEKKKTKAPRTNANQWTSRLEIAVKERKTSRRLVLMFGCEVTEKAETVAPSAAAPKAGAKKGAEGGGKGGASKDSLTDEMKTLGNVKIEGQPLSELLKASDLKALSGALIERKYDADASIIIQGEVGDAFYILKAGTVAVSTKEQGQVATLSEGAP